MGAKMFTVSWLPVSPPCFVSPQVEYVMMLGSPGSFSSSFYNASLGCTSKRSHFVAINCWMSVRVKILVNWFQPCKGASLFSRVALVFELILRL